jgi:hypothetical protein
MMYKHTVHICFCLDIASVNRNHLDMGISDSCAMSVMILESILSDCGKCVSMCVKEVTVLNNNVWSCECV